MAKEASPSRASATTKSAPDSIARTSSGNESGEMVKSAWIVTAMSRFGRSLLARASRSNASTVAA